MTWIWKIQTSGRGTFFSKFSAHSASGSQKIPPPPLEIFIPATGKFLNHMVIGYAHCTYNSNIFAMPKYIPIYSQCNVMRVTLDRVTHVILIFRLTKYVPQFPDGFTFPILFRNLDKEVKDRKIYWFEKFKFVALFVVHHACTVYSGAIPGASLSPVLCGT